MSLLVRAPFSARARRLGEVPDPVFARGIVGDGLSLVPDLDAQCVTVHAPINGVVTKLKPHAAIITSTRAVSVLVHLGIDTVGLGGKGFAPLVDEGDIVTVGEALFHWDLGPVRRAGLATCVPLVVVAPAGAPVAARPGVIDTTCSILDPLFTVEDGS